MAQVRIAGVTIPSEKKVKISLTYIFGVGETLASSALKEVEISGEKRVSELSDSEINKIREVIEKKYVVEGDLKREISSNIKRLKEISSYRGERHAKHLPVRGQRTKTNSRTVRGNVRRTMGSGKVLASQKT